MVNQEAKDCTMPMGKFPSSPRIARVLSDKSLKAAHLKLSPKNSTSRGTSKTSTPSNPTAAPKKPTEQATSKTKSSP